MSNVEKQNQINHQRNVVSAAYTYHNLSFASLLFLANNFKVKPNVISDWLCEAVEQKYIPDDIAESIKDKHIKEYESRCAITNSTLRQRYEKAFACRAAIKDNINPMILEAVSA